jgi:hypothetical protein
MLATIVAAVALGFALPTQAGEGETTWYERIDVSGDFRARSEVFVISEASDRHRLRYRLRLGGKTEVNDHIEVGFRFATGPGANSSNQTIGSGVDFDPDRIFIDLAYVSFRPHGLEKPLFGDSLVVTFGKMPNPFRPKGMGPAVLMWDGDQMPEGVALGWSATPSDRWSANFDVAYYVIDENDSARDPGMFAIQLDNDYKLHDHSHFKSQVSYYALRKLNRAFFERSTGVVGEPENNLSFGGNTSDPSDNTFGLSNNNDIDLIEFHGALSWTGCEDWPLTLWGNLIYNASATGTGVSKQNIGFGVGIEAGSESAIAKLGLGYFQIEADAVPSTLGDSDIFDGLTNGKGFQAFVTRRLWKHTDFGLTAYFGKALKNVPAQKRTPSKRIRIQTDITIKF